MKRILIIAMLGLAMSMQAQVVKEQELAVVYYMPKTELVFTFTYQQVIRQAGPYAAYAKQMLGIENPITATDTTYSIIDLQTGTRTTADKERVFKVPASKDLNTQYIALNEQGILRGYNIPNNRASKRSNNSSSLTAKQSNITSGLTPLVIPFHEADLRGNSEKERAQKIASQIFQIRETRMFILAGEVDHAPADGVAMERVLNDLNETEQQLVALFAGSVTTKTLERSFYYLPTQSEEVVLGNFNSKTGFGEGESIMLTIAAQKQVKLAPTAAPSKKDPQPSHIYYNLPGEVHYSLIYRDNKLAERTVEAPHLGVSVPLTTDLFSKDVHIYFNPKTGNIQSIYK